MCACSDLMSQDDIDALINTMAAAGDAKSKTEDLLKQIQPVMEKSLDSMGAILSAFIGIKCELLSFEVIPATRGELPAILTLEDIAFKLDMVIKTPHSVFLTTDILAIKKCVNLMTGHPADESLAQPLDDMHKSTAIEITSKVLGGMNDVFKGVTYSEDEASLTEVVGIYENAAVVIEGSLPDEYYLTTATFKINGGENWNFQLIFDGEFVSELAEVAPPLIHQKAVQDSQLDERTQTAMSDSMDKPESKSFDDMYGNVQPQPAQSQQPQYQPQQQGYYNESQYAPPQQPEPQITYQPAQFQDLPRKRLAYEARNIDMLLDVPLHITVVLGRSKVPIKSVLEYGQGSLITLDKLAGEPVDLVINGKYFAKGEVVVIDENFGVRISSILSPEERLQQLTAVQPE